MEFRANSRTNRVRKIIIFFLITSQFSCSKVQIPPHYLRQMLINILPIKYCSFPHKSEQSRKTENKLCPDLSEKLLHIVEQLRDEYMPGIMGRYNMHRYFSVAPVFVKLRTSF